MTSKKSPLMLLLTEFCIGLHDTPELRRTLSGVPKVSDAVERVFGLEKFLSTRERGSLQRNRNGW